MQLSKTKLSLYSSLQSAKMRRRHGLFTVEGMKSVRDTINTFSPEAVVVLAGADATFANGKAPVYEVTADEMSKLSGLSTPSEIMAVYKLPQQEQFDLKVNDGLYVVLDGVRDPGNLGTIVRTCHWFGIYRIFASPDTVDIFNPKCIQSTMGSLAKVHVDYCNLIELFDTNTELPVYGTLLEGDNIFQSDLEPHGFVVMGNEGRGLSAEVRARIDRPLFIPPANPANHSESLNVAIATAIVIAQIVK